LLIADSGADYTIVLRANTIGCSPLASASRNLTSLSFAREVRRRRQALGMTLEQLAERSGLTPNYIGTVENGRRDPSLSTVLALAKGLGVSPAELVGGVAELSASALEAARLFDAANSDVQAATLQLLRAVHRRRGR
jgi:transcriptional regulator with XRE-family HTH domain